MFSIAAPVGSLDTAIVLPDPQFGDSQALSDEVNLKRAMDGVRYTYVKTKSFRRLQWTFRLSANKALELGYFCRSFYSLLWQVTDQNGDVWQGNLMSNPTEFSTDRRSNPAIAPLLRGELVQVRLDFSGKLISGS